MRRNTKSKFPVGTISAQVYFPLGSSCTLLIERCDEQDARGPGNRVRHESQNASRQTGRLFQTPPFSNPVQTRVCN
jgi:hypothetical protein